MRNVCRQARIRPGCGHICAGAERKNDATRRVVWGTGHLAPFKGGDDDERADGGALCKGEKDALFG